MSGVIAHGPAGFLLRNRTQTASVFLETGSSSGEATVEKGFEWLVGDPPLNIDLLAGQTLYGIVNSGGDDQALHLLLGGLER
jgi:hypothetical protein